MTKVLHRKQRTGTKNRRRTVVTNPRRTSVTNRRREPSSRTIVLKLGGEVLEEPRRMKAVARLIARISKANTLIVVHGGGKEIDAALAQASIPKHQVDGLRITDEATLQIVVAVLAGLINTRFVAAINAAGGKAVGLTGADAGVGPVKPAKPYRATNGEFVDLGLVGEPLPVGGVPLVETLCAERFVPVIACIGASRDGRLFNVNADALAGSLAVRLRAVRLIIAGGTAGVVDTDGTTIGTLNATAVEGLVSSGTATAGMVAKLRACREALEGGVTDVAIADGRYPPRLAGLIAGTGPRDGAWTRLMSGTGDDAH
jgi:acetylglutamate kinase